MTALAGLSAEQEGRLSRWIADHLGIEDCRVAQALSGGNANLTLLLAAGEQRLVLRTPPENAISPVAHRGIERESKVLGALQGRARVPDVLGWCDDVEVLGRPFLLVSHVDGVALTDALPEAYAPGSATVSRLGEELIDELAVIQAQPWRDIGLADMGNPENFLERQIARWRGIRAETSVRSLVQLDELGEWLLHNIPPAGPVGIVHGDYHLDNTLVQRDQPRLAAVIDWELATIGDPLVDLALMLMFWGPREVDPPGFEHVQAVSRQDGVVSRQVLAQRWSSATGHSIENLNFYMCFAFWRLAAIVEGAYVLYREGKVDTPYARGLEYDVPALLQEAAAAAQGRW